MKQGIVLVALGYELYGSCALNLVMSIKAYEPNISVCLIHDKTSIAHLTNEEKSLFNHFKIAEESDYLVEGIKQYQRLKVCVDKYSPYDFSLYLDVDNIWFPDKKISWLMGELFNHDFLIGISGKYLIKEKKRTNTTYTFWHNNPQVIVDYFKLKNDLPQTISGVFYFKKNAYTQKIFELARMVYDDQAAPCMKWANGKPDEYCYNVALSMVGYEQKETHIVYFDKINGTLDEEKIYHYFWGLAIGGIKVAPKLVTLYNRLVNKCAIRLGITTRHYHVDKKNVVKERTSI